MKYYLFSSNYYGNNNWISDTGSILINRPKLQYYLYLLDFINMTLNTCAYRTQEENTVNVILKFFKLPKHDAHVSAEKNWVVYLWDVCNWLWKICLFSKHDCYINIPPGKPDNDYVSYY